MSFTHLKTLLRPVYHRAFRSQLRARFWLADRVFRKAPPEAGIPLPPAILRYRVSESLSTDMFLRVGEGCARHIDEQVRMMGTSFADLGRVLDFGCGCGRTLRWLMARYPATHFHGADVDAEAIEWCVRNLPSGAFVASSREPPLPFESGYFDAVYCFSVFTHLDERMQDLWLLEIKRVLKPAGIVILTVHGEREAGALGEEAAGILKSAGFTHRRSHKLSGIVPHWYNTSWHSEAYIVARLSRLFSDVRYTRVPDGTQDLVIAKNVSPVPGCRAPGRTHLA